MQRILITGAAGDIGQHLSQELRGQFKSFRLADIKDIPNAQADDDVIVCDLRDRDAVRVMCRDIDGIIHLGGQAMEKDWDHILDHNIIATQNLYEAARLEGVKRIIFASSNHAVGYYRRGATIGSNVTLKPDTFYGLSKAFGENLAQLYYHKHGLESLCIRIGNAADQPIDKRRLSIWISYRDLAQLAAIGLTHPDIGCDIVYGASDNARGFWDNSRAFELGYHPQDQSEDYAADVLAKEPATPADAPSEIYQGGTFVDM